MSIKTPYDVKDKTCWLFTKDGAKWHTGELIESGKVLARISAVNAETLTVRDSNNQPRLIQLCDIDRIVQVNKETHIQFMMVQLESVLCDFHK